MEDVNPESISQIQFSDTVLDSPSVILDSGRWALVPSSQKHSNRIGLQEGPGTRFGRRGLGRPVIPKRRGGTTGAYGQQIRQEHINT